MGTMGLALPWKARIASAPRDAAAAGLPRQAGKWGTRVEGSEHVSGGPLRAAVEAAAEDAALATACQAGDLRAYERLYALHGAKMKNLARNVLGSTADAEGAGKGAREADAASARRYPAVRRGRLPARGDCRDSGDYRGGVEEHNVSGKEEFAGDAGAAPKRYGAVAVTMPVKRVR